MAIVKMKRLHLLALSSDRKALFDKLQHLGCVEVLEQTDKLSDPEWATLVHRDESALEQRKAELDLVSRALDSLDKHVPEKKGLFAACPQTTADKLFDDAVCAEALKTSELISNQENALNAVNDDIQKQNTALKSLIPWLSLDVPLNFQPTGSIYAAFGMIPSSVDLDEVRENLSREAEAAELYEASTDTEVHYLFFLCHTAQKEEALGVLKGYGFSNTSFKGITGTALETYDQGSLRLSELEKQAAAMEETISTFGPARPQLQLAADRLTQEVQKEICKERLLASVQTFFLEGWVTEPDIPALEAMLGIFDCAYELIEPTEEEYPEVPVKLKNGKIATSLNTVTEMYSLPQYGSVDPNPLMAPFFILFFGMMMADMAYGLLMFFGCWLIVKKKRLHGSSAHLFNLIKYCGVTSFLFGVVTGSFFGDFLTQAATILGHPGFELPKLFSPMDDALAVMIGSLALGVIQIFTGMAISMYKQIKRGQVMAALCNEGAWYLVFILLGAAILTPFTTPCLIAILVVIVLTQGYGKKGILGKLSGIGGSLYNNITGYFSDILSYSRLMALMLAGAVIAQVFNTLGSITGNIVGYVIIAMIGNALNLALNLLSCYVHDLRLQCLEFFGRFYEDGGKAFDPVSIQTNYVDVIQ